MLPDSLQPLLNAVAYDHPADRVEFVQTHISWVLLAGDYAYKIKRPVRFGFLDYSSLAKRRTMCEREVELNRRSCAAAYLGVVPITSDNATARVGGSGPIMEYAVKMRRLEPEGWLSSRVGTVDASVDLLRDIAVAVHDFHSSAATGDQIARYGLDAEVAAIWRENLQELRSFEGTSVTSPQLQELALFGEQFLDSNAQHFDDRASSGRVRDVHGDLRSDSIYVQRDRGVCMCDCIEFSDRLRCGDVAGDVAFLAMDLDFRGHPDLADEFAGAYTRLAGDDEALPYMLTFYRCYRAAIRGKVESIAASDPEIGEEHRLAARQRAERYFELSCRYTAERLLPALIVVGGLSGSGKSHLASALAARVGAVLVRSDAIRRNAESAPITYGAAERARIYKTMREHARIHLDAGRPVVLDATHIVRGERDTARQLAADCRTSSLLVWVEADESLTRSRLTSRTTARDDMSDARWETYLAQRRSMDRLSDDELEQSIAVDGGDAATRSIAAIIDRRKRQQEDVR